MKCCDLRTLSHFCEMSRFTHFDRHKILAPRRFQLFCTPAPMALLNATVHPQQILLLWQAILALQNATTLFLAIINALLCSDQPFINEDQRSMYCATASLGRNRVSDGKTHYAWQKSYTVAKVMVYGFCHVMAFPIVPWQNPWMQ